MCAQNSNYILFQFIELVTKFLQQTQFFKSLYLWILKRYANRVPAIRVNRFIFCQIFCINFLGEGGCKNLAKKNQNNNNNGKIKLPILSYQSREFCKFFEQLIVAATTRGGGECRSTHWVITATQTCFAAYVLHIWLIISNSPPQLVVRQKKPYIKLFIL